MYMLQLAKKINQQQKNTMTWVSFTQVAPRGHKFLHAFQSLERTRIEIWPDNLVRMLNLGKTINQATQEHMWPQFIASWFIS